MSGYGDVKRRRILKLLSWLSKTGKVHISDGGRHTTIEHIMSGESFPLPTTHKSVNKHIIKSFQKWLEKHEVCTKAQFDDHL